MNNQKEHLERLKRGCNEQIYVKGYEGEESFPIGYTCGEKTKGVVFYCNSCWKKIGKIQKELNGLEKELEND